MAKHKADVNKKAVKKKIAQINEVVKEIKEYPTVALMDLKKLPDALLQKLRKSIREAGGKVRILKKPVLERVLKKLPELEKKIGECDKPMALLLTKWSPYELNKFFRDNKKKRAAKAGDVAVSEIVIPEGDTDLPPGPALSELKSAGLNVMIKAGKIVIAKDSVVAKPGDKIDAKKAGALQKLNILPFEVMANLIYGYDGKYVYTREVLDIDLTLNQDLVTSYRDAVNLSLNAGIPTSATIEIILTDAFRQGMNLAMNAEIYSSSSIEQLLSSAARQGMALESLNTAEVPKEEPKAKEKKEEPKKEGETKAKTGSDAPAKPAEEKK